MDKYYVVVMSIQKGKRGRVYNPLCTRQVFQWGMILYRFITKR